MTINITDVYMKVDVETNEPVLKIGVDFDVVYAIERLQEFGKDEFANELGMLFIDEIYKLI